MNAPILLIDDEQKVLKAYERNLGTDYAIAIESNPEQALLRLENEGPFSVVLTDYNMPRMNGNELLAQARAIAPETVRIMLTGYADLEKTMKAVNEGSVFRFLTKPCHLDQLKQCLDDAIRQYELVTAEKDLLNKTLNGSVQMMMEILSIMNHAAFSLAQKRRAAAKLIVKEMAASNGWAIEIAAMLADIGMVTLPDETMSRYLSGKPISDAEQSMINDLPQMSARLILNIPRLEIVGKIVSYQRKDYNGGGFPIDDVKGEAIPLGARILRVINDYFRFLAKGSSGEDALKFMALSREWYDPNALRVLARIAHEKSAQKKAAREHREIGAKELTVGQTLRSDVYAKDGSLILKANQVIGMPHIQRIRNFVATIGIKEPIVIDT